MTPLLFPRNPSALLGMVAALVNAALRVAIIPIFVTPVFDRVLTQRDLSALPGVLGLAALLVVAGALALLAQDALLGRAAAEVTATWRSGLYRSLLGRWPGQLPGSSGGLSSRVLTDLKDVETYYHFGLGTLVAESFTLLGILAVLFYLSGSTTLYLLLMAAPLILLLNGLGQRIARVTRDSQAGTEALGAHLQEGLRHHAVVRAFRAADFMLARFERVNRETRRLMSRRSLLSSLPIPLAQLLVFAALGVLVAVLAGSAAAGRMTVGEVVTYLTLVALLATPAQLLPRGYALLKQAAAASERLHALLELPQPPELTPSLPPPTVANAGLELRDLQFGYAPKAPVLQGLNLSLPARGLVAITGESGSGKSTLLHLLLRFLKPGSGAIFLAGEALATMAERDLRARVAYVPQSSDLLSGTLRDNLLLGREADDVRLWELLEAVRLSEAIRALPGQLDYVLREDGAGLSGGQRQRLAVARALLGAPALLLLDEPSANLDEDSEAVLAASLRRQAAERLVLVVAHRPALVEVADRVLRLERGRLLEVGVAR